jgi:syntaxin 16
LIVLTKKQTKLKNKKTNDKQGFNTEQMMILKEREDLAAEREREIKKITDSIFELAQIFKDLQILVIDQVNLIFFFFNF